jgi:hypothetical protein
MGQQKQFVTPSATGSRVRWDISLLIAAVCTSDLCFCDLCPSLGHCFRPYRHPSALRGSPFPAFQTIYYGTLQKDSPNLLKMRRLALGRWTPRIASRGGFPSAFRAMGPKEISEMATTNVATHQGASRTTIGLHRWLSRRNTKVILMLDYSNRAKPVSR